MQDFAEREAASSTIRSAEPAPRPVSRGAFTVAMNQRWSALGNTPSPSLEQIWGTIADTFSDAITVRDRVWRVLQPPTGTGKTQGLCVYAALTIGQNLSLPHPIGILIVTRTIQQANEILEAIRSLAPDGAAARAQTSHSQNSISRGAMEAADVLIVTHAAFALGLEARQADKFGRLADYTNWANGPRLLTIIDEPLAGLIEENQITAQDVAKAITCMSGALCLEFSKEFKTLWELRDFLHFLDRKAAKAKAEQLDPVRMQILWSADDDGGVTYPRECSMAALRKAMSGLPYDQILNRKDSADDRKRIAKRVDKTLSKCEAIARHWCFSYQKGSDATLNSGQFLIPPDLPGPVVLDATATQNFLWKLMGDRALLVPITEDARRYANVNLHVARVGSGLGKGSMQDKGKVRIPRLLADLKKRLSPERRILLCLHQVIEHIALGLDPGFASFSVSHFGALDGRNDWHNHDTVVVFGLPYRDNVWSTIMFFALKGLQSEEWLRKPAWGPYKNVHLEMQRGHLTASIIQAINRICCRRVIDAEGNCPTADIFLLLPDGAEGSAILSSIEKEMPGIVVKSWAFEPDGPEGRIRRGTAHAQLLAFMRGRLPGETGMSLIKTELGLSDSAYKDLMKVLRDAAHPLCLALNQIGVSYVSAGRGSRAFLIKR